MAQIAKEETETASIQVRWVVALQTPVEGKTVQKALETGETPVAHQTLIVLDGVKPPTVKKLIGLFGHICKLLEFTHKPGERILQESPHNKNAFVKLDWLQPIDDHEWSTLLFAWQAMITVCLQENGIPLDKKRYSKKASAVLAETVFGNDEVGPLRFMGYECETGVFSSTDTGVGHVTKQNDTFDASVISPAGFALVDGRDRGKMHNGTVLAYHPFTFQA